MKRYAKTMAVGLPLLLGASAALALFPSAVGARSSHPAARTLAARTSHIQVRHSTSAISPRRSMIYTAVRVGAGVRPFRYARHAAVLRAASRSAFRGSTRTYLAATVTRAGGSGTTSGTTTQSSTGTTYASTTYSGSGTSGTSTTRAGHRCPNM